MLACILYYLCVGAVVLLVVDDGQREGGRKGREKIDVEEKWMGGRGEGIGGMLPGHDMFSMSGKMISYHNCKIVGL